MSTFFGKTKCVQRDKENLADIAWYIKGRIDMGDDTFHQNHLDSLSDAMNLILNNIKERDPIWR